MVLREHVKGHERACEGSQSRKASTTKNMKFSGKKVIAAKSVYILPYFKVNLSDSQTLPLITIGYRFGMAYIYIILVGPKNSSRLYTAHYSKLKLPDSQFN